MKKKRPLLSISLVNVDLVTLKFSISISLSNITKKEHLSQPQAMVGIIIDLHPTPRHPISQGPSLPIAEQNNKPKSSNLNTKTI